MTPNQDKPKASSAKSYVLSLHPSTPFLETPKEKRTNHVYFHLRLSFLSHAAPEHEQHSSRSNPPTKQPTNEVPSIEVLAAARLHPQSER